MSAEFGMRSGESERTDGEMGDQVIRKPGYQGVIRRI